jgi:hypothetical protein
MRTFFLLTLAILLNAVAPAIGGYRADGQIGKGKLGFISQLTIDAEDRVCTLEKTGKVTVFHSDGTVASVIETGMANTGAIAVDERGRFHIFATLTEEKKVKAGARLRTVQIPVGVEWGIFNPAGDKLKTAKLPELKSAKAAKIVGDKLVVADLTARALIIMDLESGEETARVDKGLRLCCGIFDFCEAPNRTVAISNLGAFKLQRFDLEGNRVSEFGKRGRSLNEFQGCCNPVSAGYLPDGRIVTVEKDPTRIKIYDAEGRNAEQMEGVEELVKGCSFIPVAVNSQGHIFLAAADKGYVVKCTP